MSLSPVTNHIGTSHSLNRTPITNVITNKTLGRLTLDRPPHQHSLKHLSLESTFLKSVNDDGSPPVRLGRRWLDYQGARNWDGLLNPLDPNLRSEILRYGYFVEAAYRSFDFDSSSPSYATCNYGRKDLLEEAGFPDTGYRVTKNLRATSGIQMPRWTEKAASWATMQSSWIGYVAVCTDKAEIQRLGRRDVVIALRGTATCLEWMENLRATQTEIPCSGGAMVESGFLSLYKSATDTCPSLQDTLRKEVKKILETYKGEQLSFTITGHSLGAALATLAAYDIKTEFKDETEVVTVISFGGPRVGNKRFRCHVEEQGIKILRIVNPDDLITKLPGFIVEDDEEEEEDDVAEGWANWWGIGCATSEWFQKRVVEKQWAYAEVGCELRVEEEKKQVPYKYNWMNMNLARCHDLKTYLSLVGSSVSSNCPLRETAKRLLTN